MVEDDFYVIIFKSSVESYFCLQLKSNLSIPNFQGFFNIIKMYISNKIQKVTFMPLRPPDLIETLIYVLMNRF